MENMSTPPVLPKRFWRSVGLREVRGPGGEKIVTHTLGDEHAEKVLRGGIPFKEARRLQQQAERNLDALRVV